MASSQEEIHFVKEAEVVNIEIENLIAAIYARFHYDFRLYSRSSLRRRLEQALVKYHCASVTDLQNMVLHEPSFFPKLLSYLTVNTTEMFRDPTYFASLKEKVFPFLRTFPSIKIWIAGCSTGEEVLSFAILLREAGFKKYLIYATDINPMNLEVAKKGIYSADTISKASKNYQIAGGTGSLSDYYSAAYDAVQFDHELLKNVVFSDHSLSTDAVFSETHLVSCRNVLIYFERELQNRVFQLFNDSLVRDGYLGLGNKETLMFSTSKNNFTTIDSENRIFQKKDLR